MFVYTIIRRTAFLRRGLCSSQAYRNVPLLRHLTLSCCCETLQVLQLAIDHAVRLCIVHGWKQGVDMVNVINGEPLDGLGLSKKQRGTERQARMPCCGSPDSVLLCRGVWVSLGHEPFPMLSGMRPGVFFKVVLLPSLLSSSLSVLFGSGVRAAGIGFERAIFTAIWMVLLNPARSLAYRHPFPLFLQRRIERFLKHPSQWTSHADTWSSYDRFRVMFNDKAEDADPLCLKLRTACSGIEQWIRSTLKRWLIEGRRTWIGRVVNCEIVLRWVRPSSIFESINIG